MRKRLAVMRRVGVVFTALLPSLVAGQNMACTSSDPTQVEFSTETVATFNSIADGVATFAQLVCSPSIHILWDTRTSANLDTIWTLPGGHTDSQTMLVLAGCLPTPPLSCDLTFYHSFLFNI